MEELLWLPRSTKLICLSIFISGLIGYSIYGKLGFFYAIVGTLFTELVFWLWNK